MTFHMPKSYEIKYYNFLELYAHWKGDSGGSGNCQTGKGGADLKIIIYTQHSYGGGGGEGGVTAPLHPPLGKYG